MIAREVGLLPLSIGTSPAIQAFDSSTLLRPMEQVISREVTMVMINLSTLIRNYFASMTGNIAENFQAQEIYDELLGEISWIKEYIEGFKKKCVFYFQDVRHIPYLFSKAEIKENTTEKQITEWKLHEHLLKNIVETMIDKPFPDKLSNDTRLYDGEYGKLMEVGLRPPREMEVVGIVTHEPHHLLWQYRYQRLYLFESHTGAVKGPADFHTKLKTLKRDEVFPFNGLSLSIFGDGVHIKPQSLKIRRELLEVAVSAKWTRLTSPGAMLYGIKDSGSDALKDAYAKLINFIN